MATIKESRELQIAIVNVLEATVNMLKANKKPVNKAMIIGNITLLSAAILDEMDKDS